jgi:thiol-disulfide isomerase/thioredoxin
MDYNKKYLKYKAKYIKLKNIIDTNENQKIMLGGKNNTKNTINLFKADWCPHCNQFKPVWSKLQNEFGSKLNFVTYDSTENADEIKKYKIEGFPTLILQTGNKAIEYVGPRDEFSIKEFINQYS